MLMSLAHRARTAFAVLAISASLLGSALPTAASAAQVDPTHPTPNGPQMPPPQLPPIVTPVPNLPRRDQKPPLPDVSVVTVGHSGSNVSPDHLDVAFNLKTTGADANNIVLKGECVYRYLNDPSLIVTEQKPLQGMSLSASWAPPVPFLVTCAPSYGQFVSSVFLTADVAGDSNPVNNTGSWDHITNK
jgi:hypothetical protein